jgi:hypothetical protein
MWWFSGSLDQQKKNIFSFRVSLWVTFGFASYTSSSYYHGLINLRYVNTSRLVLYVIWQSVKHTCDHIYPLDGHPCFLSPLSQTPQQRANLGEPGTQVIGCVQTAAQAATQTQAILLFLTLVWTLNPPWVDSRCQSAWVPSESTCQTHYYYPTQVQTILLFYSLKTK